MEKFRRRLLKRKREKTMCDTGAKKSKKVTATADTYPLKKETKEMIQPVAIGERNCQVMASTVKRIASDITVCSSNHESTKDSHVNTVEDPMLCLDKRGRENVNYQKKSVKKLNKKLKRLLASNGHECCCPTKNKMENDGPTNLRSLNVKSCQFANDSSTASDTTPTKCDGTDSDLTRCRTMSEGSSSHNYNHCKTPTTVPSNKSKKLNKKLRRLLRNGCSSNITENGSSVPTVTSSSECRASASRSLQIVVNSGKVHSPESPLSFVETPSQDRYKSHEDSSGCSENGDYHISELDTAKYVAMDCEFVGVGKLGKGMRNALGRCTIVDFNGDVILDDFCKPSEAVMDYRTPWSGIRKRDLDKGLPFSDVRKAVIEIIKDKIVIGHAVFNDFKVLKISHPWEKVRDTGFYKPLYQRAQQEGCFGSSLKKMAKYLLGRDIQRKEHDSVEDARATLDLYKLIHVEWEGKICKKNSRQATLSMGKRKTDEPPSKSHQLDPLLDYLSDDPVMNYLSDEFWPDDILGR